MMKRTSLERWLVRAVQGCDRLELTHKSADDDSPRIVRTYGLAGGADKDRLAEVSAEVLADSQDETDLAEARCTFVLAGLQDDRVLASVRIRCDPVRDDGRVDPDAQEEPSKEGMMAMVMRQNRELHHLVLAVTAPKRQQEGIELVISVLTKELREQRDENTKLRALVAAKGGDDVEVTAELIEEQRQNAEITQHMMLEGLQIVKSFVANRGPAEATAANGSANGGNGHDA